tara:strand:+ start:437 stop:1411 length:975 start_codon:yes stop_codon:yes gene_type:complete
MSKPLAIIAGEPNSISSEIIFKFWKQRKKFKHKPLFVIGNLKLLKLQNKKLNHKISFKEIKFKFKKKDLNGNKLPVYNIEYSQNKAFQKISSKSNKYIFSCFDIALRLCKKKKILGLINCPVAKEFLFKRDDIGITEYLSKKSNLKNKEVMLIYNKKLSVSPFTTHVPLSQVRSKLNKIEIIKKINTINNFYTKYFNKKPKIAVLGLNPHNFSSKKNPEEKKIIIPAIKAAKKKKLKVFGPISTDTSFMIYSKYKFDVIFGMYHDQVLTAFKALFKYNAINITLGLPFIRISPDHGVATNIVGKNTANPTSLIQAIKFFNYISR